MDYLTRLLLGLGLAIPMSVWAGDNTQDPVALVNQYINLGYNATAKSLYLEQAGEGCTVDESTEMAGASVTCLASKNLSESNNSFAETLNQMLSSVWATTQNESKNKYTNLTLASDLNFGETYSYNEDDDTESCSTEHTPIKFGGKVFDGNGHTIKNLCYIQRKDGDRYIGLFGKIGYDIPPIGANGLDISVKNLTISGVNFVVGKKWYSATGETLEADPSTNGVDYYPMGALAGQISYTNVDNITLDKVVIRSPFAGGLAGLIRNSKVSQIYSDKTTAATSLIALSNSVQLVETPNVVDLTNFIGASIGETSTDGYMAVMGGIAAISKFTTYENIEINVDINNSASVDKSVLGGVAGMYVYAQSGSDNNKPYLNQDIKVSVPSGKKVTGGTSIGGVFGETKKDGSNNQTKSDLLISNVNVKRLEAAGTGAAGNETVNIYWGGVIGKSNLCNGSVLKIVNATASVVLVDLNAKAGTYNYFVGGIAGYAGCDNTTNVGNGDDLFLTLKNSNTSGNIKIWGKSFSEQLISASIGGLVGTAMLATEENAIAGNTSSIRINYDIDSPNSTATKVTGTVSIGGAFGAASMYNTSGVVLKLSGLNYNGSLAVKDYGINTYVGGIVGRFPLIDNSGNSQIAFNDVHVKPSGNITTLLQYTYMNAGFASTSYIGGVCGNCKSVTELSVVSVEGDIKEKQVAAANKAFYVGGLVGRSSIGAPIIVKNTYSNGSLTKEFPSNSDIGYLFGVLYGNTGRASQFISNYHYSEEPEKIPAISIGDGKKYPVPTYQGSTAKNNVRNCTANETQSVDQTGNGCMASANMKSSDFAETLNQAMDDESDQVWMYDENAADAAPLPTLKPALAPNLTTHSVKFLDGDGSLIKEYEVVHGWPSPVPNPPTVNSVGCSFDKWNSTDYLRVTANLTIAALYEDCAVSSSSMEISSSSSEEESSSSEMYLSSSNVTESSSSFAVSSSSETSSSSIVESSSSETSSSSIVESSSNGTSSSSIVVNSSSSADVSSSSSSAGNGDYSSSSSAGNIEFSSSSSSAGDGGDSSSSSVVNVSSSSSVKSSSSSATHKKYLLDIAEPTATQDGSGLRMEFDPKLANTSEKVDYHIQVVSQKGIYLDTVVDGKAVGNVKNGTWRLDPAPVGEYTVTFMLTDGKDSIPYTKTFTSMDRHEVASHSWQTLSLYAFCSNKGEECLSDLETRFARMQSDRAKEECQHLQDEVKRGVNDAQIYQKMKDVCAQANGSGSVTSVYWWDESNPIGDFWQYRKFSVKDKFDSTRGYWYGTIDNEPLVMNLQTPDTSAAIVWKLENKYSGWNLVANPYGWYAKLPKEKGLQFCKWNAETSDYEEPDVLGPYEAIWVHTEKSMTYRIPLKAAIVLEEEKKALSKSADSENWNLRVVLSDNNGKRDSWNELAAGKSASSLGEPPAGMGDRVNLSILDGKKHLVRSVKKNADDLEWNLEVSATTTRDGHLSFEGLESVWAKGMRVYAMVDNETVEVVKDSPLDVKLSSKVKNVSVRVTKSAVVANVAKNLLKGLRVNQTPNVLNVGFDAASKLAGENVKVSVVGIDGRIAVTGKFVANAGTNAIAMKKPKQGVYFVKVKVGSQSAVTRVMVR